MKLHNNVYELNDDRLRWYSAVVEAMKSKNIHEPANRSIHRYSKDFSTQSFWRTAINLLLLTLAISFFSQETRAQEWPVNSVATSSAIWPASNLNDGNPNSVWSSNGYGDSNHSEWLAYWFDGFHAVNYIKLYPRFANGATLGFPTQFSVYWSDGSQWNLAQSYVNVPTSQNAGYVILPLPTTVNANGIHVVANQLGADNVGGYYFQIGEVGAGLHSTVGIPAMDYFRNLLPGNPIIKFTNGVPTAVTVSNVDFNLYRITQPADNSESDGTPIKLRYYGGAIRECLKINPNNFAPNWTCYATYPLEYNSAERALLEGPAIDAICGYRTLPPALIMSCNGNQCVSEIFMLGCDTRFPGLTSSTTINTAMTNANFGSYISDPDWLSNQSFSNQYVVTANLNTAMNVLAQGHIPIFSIGLNDLDNALAKFPQLFAPGAKILIADEPFWDGDNLQMVQGQFLDDQIKTLQQTIAVWHNKVPTAQLGLNVLGLPSLQPAMMAAMEKLIQFENGGPNGDLSGGLQWLATDPYVTTFGSTGTNTLLTKADALSAANWFSDYMKAQHPDMGRWLIVQGFGPVNDANAVTPSMWTSNLESKFKDIMTSMGLAGAEYTGVLVWGWNDASEINDAFAGKNFSPDIKDMYQVPSCNAITVAPTVLPSAGGTVTAQASCANNVLKYKWTIDNSTHNVSPSIATIISGNTPSTSIVLGANTSGAALNYVICVTAIKIGHSQPLCAILTQPNMTAMPPSAPIVGTAVEGSALIHVYFTPGALGTGTLVNYTANCGGITALGISSPITVSSLTNGTAYTCQVKTTSSVGTSAWSVLSNAVIPVAPTPILLAPTIGTATAGISSATVTFTPSTLGTGTLINYTAACGGTFAIGTGSPITVTGLSSDTTYFCHVKTNSSTGSSLWSDWSSQVTPLPQPAVLPSVPTIGTSTAGNGAVIVNFTVGALGTGTLVNHTANCNGITATGIGSPIVVTGLSNGATYTCQVKTETTTGSSTWSGSSNQVIPVEPPAAPIIGVATPGDATATVTFTPGTLGTGTLIKFTANCGGITATGSSSPITVTGLSNGMLYSCTVNTTTSIGVSLWSLPSNSITPMLQTIPSAPTIGTATAGVGSATVSFTPAALGTGTLITYTAACGGTFATGTSSPITVTGLFSGTPYFCHVKTTSSIGTSTWSDWTSNPVYP